MNLNAANVYFKTTAATSWWANDGAKIGALFKVGTDPLDDGAYAAFFTLVPGTTDTYVGIVPESEEDPFVAVQFLRYNSAATNPEDMNYWNGTALMTWDGTNDMFTATAFGDTWDSTTGTWSKYSPAGPDMHDFLHFVSLKDNGSVKINKIAKVMGPDSLTATFEYSKDRINWTAYDTWATQANPKSTYQGTSIALAEGDTIFFRAKGKDGKNATLSYVNDYFTFVFGADDSIAAGGNVMSLYDATCEQDTMTVNGFTYLLNRASQLVSVLELKLPATKLAVDCYCGLFQGCTALTQAPELPADSLAAQCYRSMFSGCTALTQAPELKATTLGDYCCNNMFKNCSKLEVDTFSLICDGAELVVPDTTAAPTDWNKDMFIGCNGNAVGNIQLGGHYCIREYGKPRPIYGRKVTNGNFGTICLDKQFVAMEGVEGLYVPYEKTATMLYCEEVELKDVVAGGAYIFKANADSVTFALEGEAVTEPANNDHMRGWLKADFVLTGETDSYMLYNNQIIKPEVGSTILKNRAFIDLDNVPAKAAAPARGRMIAFGINGTTGLVELNDNANLNDNRKVMRNGQLIIIRDSKMYNAQGAQL